MDREAFDAFVAQVTTDAQSEFYQTAQRARDTLSWLGVLSNVLSRVEALESAAGTPVPDLSGEVGKLDGDIVTINSEISDLSNRVGALEAKSAPAATTTQPPASTGSTT